MLLDEVAPDVVGVSEHWCTPDSIKTMSIPGYLIADYYCRPTREHGGSMIYVKSDVKMKNLNVSTFSEEMNCEISGTVVMANKCRIAILSVYRPGSGNFEVFLERLSYALNHCTNLSDIIFLGGDMNVNYLKNDCTKLKLFMDLIECFGLRVSSQKPTRIFTDSTGRTTISKIDYLLTNADPSVCDAEVFETYLGDHKAILVDVNVRLEKVTHSPPRFVRNLSQININKLVLQISKSDFRGIYQSDDIDSCFDSFIVTIQSAFDLCCPLVKLNTSNHQTKGWITPEITVAKRDLMSLHWLHSNLKTQVTFTLYKNAKLNYNLLLRDSKLQFHNMLISRSSNRNKTVWNMVNSLTGRGKRKNEPIELDIDGFSYDSPQEVADIFADYFSTVAETTLLRYYQNSLSTTCTTSYMSHSTFFFHPVSEFEVADAISSLKNNKISGPNSVSARILKTISPVICQHFAHCINLSINQGVFPSSLKKTTVIPVFKKNNIRDITNYRPISLLNSFSKVFEKIVLGRMTKYSDRYDILNNSQHGFRSGRSTQTAAVQFTEYLYECLDSGFHVAGLFFDLSRAFDTLSFNFIMEKCYNLGFRGIFLEWLKSYLEKRPANVKVGDTLSSEYSLKLGIPQGSVLGPLLFLLFINDLPKCLGDELSQFCSQNGLPSCTKMCSVVLFADDTSFAVRASSFEELQILCEFLLGFFVKWCHMNNLVINVDKTEIIHFSISGCTRKLVLRHHDTVITSNVAVKFLGIFLDENLRWFNHIDSVCSKLNSSYFAINRVRHLLPVPSLISIYYSLVFSHLSYNVLLWGNSSEAGRVFIIQKRILRMIFNISPRSSCRPVFAQNDILTLACIFILRTLLYIKEKEHCLPKLSSFHNYHTRNETVLFIPKHKSKKFEKSPMYQGIKLFNHLPSHIQTLNIREFKGSVKTLLLKQCYYTVDEFLNDVF